MYSTVAAGPDADVASAVQALGRALGQGVEALTHDESAALLTRRRTLPAKADALALAVRTARSLRSGVLPATAAALAAGRLSGRHAAVIADAVTAAPAGAVALIEPEAVAAAVEGDLRSTANVMRAFQHALDPDRADEKALRR